MSFYQNGMRFAGRRSSTGQTPTTDPSHQLAAPAPTQRQTSANAQSHPLRQNSVEQHASYQRAPGSSAPRDPKSYAARANVRPDLSVNTNPGYQKRTPQFSPDTTNNSYPHTAQPMSAYPHDDRRDSLPDRSPLQNLEVKLGGISKEEKRARVEEAEHNARSREALANGGSSSRKKRQSVNGARGIPRKPVPSSPGSSGDSRRGHSRPVQQPRNVVPERSLSNKDHYTPRSRSHGYDAALTGGAAAAAVGVYQTTHQKHNEQASSSSDISSDPNPGDVGYPLRNGSAARPTGNRDGVNMPDAQKQRPIDQIGSSEHGNGTNKLQQNGELPPTNVPTNDMPDVEYRTSTAPEAARTGRAHVGSHNADDGEHSKRGSLRFSHLMHPHSEGQGRRYRGTVPLTEWKTARTAILQAQDLDLKNDANNKAWWEQSKSSRRQSQKRTSAGETHSGGAADGKSQTAFSPSLMLRCGPLLRYTGIRGDTDAGTGSGRSFWKGSIMIVTDDASSSLGTPPTLRLFAQPMSLFHLSSTPAAAETQEQHAPERVDPLAGQSKCSPTGRTLYVRPVAHLQPEVDLSRTEGSNGLFATSISMEDETEPSSRLRERSGEGTGQYKDVRGHRLHTERGVTFWRFNIEVELGYTEARIAYRINQGPAIGFWVPARTQPMNVMFHSCNGFSASVDSNKFSGPDPLWRDVLNSHQQRPFHVMLGGGDQIYNDRCTQETRHFHEWTMMKNSEHKHSAPFSEAMQEELEVFYLDRYAMWFSQGLFGMANSQIPMINVWDDHDILDGFGSYPHHFMNTPIFTGIGAIAYKYYMLFQHQSLPSENEETEPSWILGTSPGPYINQLSRSVYMSLGHGVALCGVDCRTERMREEVVSEGTYHAIFDRLDRELVKGETKHLFILLGIPIAYPRMNFAENILTSRAMDPVKALARVGVFGGFLNKFDGGVEILDDLDDHWTAKHHKEERKWFIEVLQDLAAEKSIRITILGGDVHLAAVGQFYSKKKLGIPKDHDHRYMPNIISSAIVNTPPPEGMADFLNKRNKVHHFDDATDEDMIPLFTYDVNGKDRNNHHLLPRRNWCSIRPYAGDLSRAASPEPVEERPARRARSFSLTRSRSADSATERKRPNVLRKLSNKIGPPSSFRGPTEFDNQRPYSSSGLDPRVDGDNSNRAPRSDGDDLDGLASSTGRPGLPRANSFQRRPSTVNSRALSKDPTGRQGHIDLEGGLEVCFNCEVDQKDPAGTTMPYRMLIPALFYDGRVDSQKEPQKNRLSSLFGSMSRKRSQKEVTQGVPYEDTEPATPAFHGDKRYTTMMEEGGKPSGIAGDGLDEVSGGANAEAQRIPSNQSDAAYLEHLPRSSGPVETDAPSEVRASFEQRRGSLDRMRARSHSRRGSGSGSEIGGRSELPPPVPNLTQQQQQQHQQQQPVTRSNTAPTAPRPPIAPPPTDGTISHRRYYAQPFKKDEAPLLGAVNNRIESQPVAKTAFEHRQANAAAGLPRERRTSSNPVPVSTTTIDDASAVASSMQPQRRENAQQPSHAYNNNVRSTATTQQPKVKDDISAELRNRAQKINAPSASRALPAATAAAGTGPRPSRMNGKSREKDPYAHYYPENVEAEYDSAASDSGDDGVTSSLDSLADDLSVHEATAAAQHIARASLAKDTARADLSVHEATTAAQHIARASLAKDAARAKLHDHPANARDHPRVSRDPHLHASTHGNARMHPQPPRSPGEGLNGEDDLESLTPTDSMTPSPSPSPPFESAADTRRRPVPVSNGPSMPAQQGKRLSKVERLTGESGGVPVAHAPSGNNEGYFDSAMNARSAAPPVDLGPGQFGVSDKAAKRLGVMPPPIPAGRSNGTTVGTMSGGSTGGSGRGKLGGFVKRLSETKAGRRLSVGGKA